MVLSVLVNSLATCKVWDGYVAVVADVADVDISETYGFIRWGDVVVLAAIRLYIVKLP